MIALALHGGAGTLSRTEMTPDRERVYLAGLKQALDAGYAILARGGTALDAVEQTTILLENNELFNAGRGSVFTAEGRHELDASIMCGRTRNAGAIAGVHNIRNPITLARVAMERSGHVMLAGAGAEKFAREQQIETAPDEYYYTDMRWEEWQRKSRQTEVRPRALGTVGAVALDHHGDVAAATSTGGTTNKRYGRIGDSPVIGAGTYANNRTCAVSCTGDGEYFIRSVTAYDVSCLVEYRGLSLQEACTLVIQDKMTALGGEGGLIAVDPAGQVALVFNSEGMYRGWQREGEAGQAAIF
nr:isoaspartyl peptidase/L-asparaginase [uncultured Arsenicibacter sp.]